MQLQLIKKHVKCRNILSTHNSQIQHKLYWLIIFFRIVFASLSYDLTSASTSMIWSPVIIESSIILVKYFLFLQLHIARFQIWSFYTYNVFTLTLTFTIIPLLIWITFFWSNLHLHLHDVCLVNIFDSFIAVIMLRTLRFNSSVLFETHTLSDNSLRVLQLPTHLFSLTVNE